MNRDWAEKDFYKVLGVSKDADQEEIKRAYRKLAQKLHPDANPGDTKAEERFKEVSEAYAVVGNAEKRKEYDEVRRLVDSGAFGGFGGFGGPGGGAYGAGGQRIRVEDLDDLLSGFGGLGDLFGGAAGGGAGRGRTNRRSQPGSDLTADLHLSFTDAVHGVTTSVQVRGEAFCSKCQGSGAEPGTKVSTCPTCNGAGSVAQNQGVFSFAQPCSQCRGTGRFIEQPCSTCNGSGRTLRTRTIRVKIPAGVRDGQTIRLRGKGAPGSGGGPAGDLLVKVDVADHDVFGRKGNDLTVNVPITFSEAALGTKVEVPTMEGSVTVKVPSGTPSGKTFRVKGKGVVPAKGRAGDLLVRVEVIVPKKLSRDEKKLVEQLAEYDRPDLRDHLKAHT